MLRFKKRSICDYKLREILPFLGGVVILLNVIGYLGGFLLVDLNFRYQSRRINYAENDFPEVNIRPISIRPNHIYHRTTDNGVHELDGKMSPVNDRTTVTTAGHIKRTPGPNRPPSDGGVSKTVIQSWEACSYRSGRDVKDGRWFNFSVPSYRFYAYSAIIDDRSSLMSDPVIRVIAVALKPEKEAEEANLKFYCVLHYDPPNENVYVAMEKTPRPIGHGWIVNNEWLREYIFTCPIFKDQVPKAIAFVAHPGDIVASCMPVEVPEKPKKKEDLAVCVQVAFEKLDSYRVVEWLELLWLLGVRLVGIHNLSLDDMSIGILDQYVKDGFVELRKTNYIADGPQQHLLHGSPVINDCIYRNMHKFNYIMVIDFDEFIMPRNETTIPQLIDRLKVDYSKMQFPPINYVFYNVYFFLDLPPDTFESPYLTFLRYRNRVAVSPYGHAVKSIVHTGACIAMHNHYCWTVTPQYTDRGFPQVVEPTIAVSQHYKKCHFNETECYELKAKFTIDDGILRFKKELKARVEDKIHAILGHQI